MMMEWITIDYNGTEIWAADFCNGVWVKEKDHTGKIFVPGYYVCEPTGDMDGPALRPRKTQGEEYEFRIVPHGRV